MTERWYGCPLCGRLARTSRQLTAQGCEGKHIELMSVEEAEKALEKVRTEIVAAWHDGAFGDRRLPECLGMTDLEYARWVEGLEIRWRDREKALEGWRASRRSIGETQILRCEREYGRHSDDCAIFETEYCDCQSLPRNVLTNRRI